MTKAAEELKTKLSALSPEDRAALAHYLIESLDSEEDPDREAAWDAELARRAVEIQSSQAEGLPAEEIFTERRKKHSWRPE